MTPALRSLLQPRQSRLDAPLYCYHSSVFSLVMFDEWTNWPPDTWTSLNLKLGNRDIAALIPQTNWKISKINEFTLLPCKSCLLSDESNKVILNVLSGHICSDWREIGVKAQMREKKRQAVASVPLAGCCSVANHLTSPFPFGKWGWPLVLYSPRALFMLKEGYYSIKGVQ